MIKTVTASNFMSFEHLHLNLEGKGILQIDGTVLDEAHADNNGVGKTAVLDLILWTLFGQCRRSERVNDIIHAPAGKDCMGAVTVETPYGTLHVQRYRKHHQFSNEVHMHLNGAKVEGTDNSDVQAKLEATLGFDYKTFQRALIFDGSMSLAKMTDTDAKDFFERLIGVDLSSWHTTAKTFERTCEDQLQSAKNGQAQLQAQIETMASHISQVTTQQKEWLGTRDQHVAQHEAHITSLEAANTVNRDRVQSLKASKVLGERHVTHLRQEMATHHQSQGAYQTALTNVAMAKAAQEDASDWLAVVHQQNDIGVPAMCETCGQQMPEESQQRVRDLHAKAVDDATERVHTTTDHRASMEYVLNKLAQPSVATELQTKLDQINQDVHGLNVSIVKWEAEIDKNGSTIATSRESITRLSTDPYAATLTDLGVKYQDALVKETEAAGNVAWYEDYVEGVNTVVRMFSKEGLRAHVLSNLIPFMNVRLHRYLGILTNGEIQADFKSTTNTGRERFNVDVRRRHGGSSYASLSQGERARLDLAMTLTVLDHIRTRVHVPVVFFDELFDALDETGVERVMSLLREVSQNSLVVVISHNDAVRMHVDQVVMIEKEGGVSRVAQ